ncbi:hypothetical protein HK101_008767 [Irineochytrium annulatum]|nr:hypothetical protein HK101_008767 [Irineochytrium annulatum]
MTLNPTLALTDLALGLFLSTIVSRLHPSQRAAFASCMHLAPPASSPAAVPHHRSTHHDGASPANKGLGTREQPLTPPTSLQSLAPLPATATTATATATPMCRVASEVLLLRRLIHFSATLHPSHIQLTGGGASLQQYQTTQTHHMAFYAIILVQRMIRLSPRSAFVQQASASSLMMAGLMLAEAHLGDVQTSAKVWSGLSGGTEGVTTTLSHAPAVAKALALEALGFDSHVDFAWFRALATPIEVFGNDAAVEELGNDTAVEELGKDAAVE